jgi:hypothetical protein
MALDPQQVEVIGRGWLISEQVRAGLEAATPIRDNGVDLLLTPAEAWALPAVSGKSTPTR